MQLWTGPSRLDCTAGSKVDFVSELEQQVFERFDAIKLGVHELGNFVNQFFKGVCGGLHRLPAFCGPFFAFLLR